MAGNVKHRFSNPKSDGGDATITRPSNWNDAHDVVTVVEKDFGSSQTLYGSWSISDTNVASTSHIVAWLITEAPTGRDADEAQMEPMDVFAEDMATNSFTLVALVQDGPVDGLYKFAYIVS